MINTLVSLIATSLAISESGITKDTTFASDLGMDSLDTVELVTAVEAEFDIEVLDGDIASLTTVGEALVYIEQKLSNKEPKMAKKATFTENDMQHELNKRAKAAAIDINIDETGKLLDIFETIVTEKLIAGEIVKMRNFGSFEAKDQKERNRYNPATKQTELVPAHKAPKFDASDALRDAVRAS